MYSLKLARDALAESIIIGLAPSQADGDKRIQREYAQKKGKIKEYALKIEMKDAEDHSLQSPARR